MKTAGYSRVPVKPAVCVLEADSLELAMRRLDETALQILFVVDANGRLIGTLTDGDIRRRLLQHGAMSDPVASACNREPVAVQQSREKQGIKRMRELGISRAPLVDAQRKVTELVLLDQRDGRTALLLAGGRGTRLGDLTREVPKPLLPVGDKPIIRHLIEALSTAGFDTVYIAIHHLGDRIREHFAAAPPENIELTFIEEEVPLGTAGSLGLLPATLTDPILVLNGDLVTRTNLGAMMDFHREHQKGITIGCAQYRHEVPFGVLEHEAGNVSRIVEKPVFTRYVSAGLYVIDAIVYRMVRTGNRLDMPGLINMALESGMGAATFPIVEYWIDVGVPDQLERARGDFRGAVAVAR
jgi:dTDP-glucose pyrophosphorylase